MAGITYGDSGTNRTITAMTYGDGGTNRVVTEAWYGDGATKRLVFSGYTPPSIIANDVTGSTTVGNTNDFIGIGSSTVSNGVPSFSYSTVYVSGSTAIIISASSTANPAFNRSGNPGAVTVSAVFNTTVTDGNSNTASDTFTVTDNRSV